MVTPSMHGLAASVRAVDCIPATCDEHIAATSTAPSATGTTRGTPTGEHGVLIAAFTAQ
jgi:hypothetical protein